MEKFRKIQCTTNEVQDKKNLLLQKLTEIQQRKNQVNYINNLVNIQKEPES